VHQRAAKPPRGERTWFHAKGVRLTIANYEFFQPRRLPNPKDQHIAALAAEIVFQQRGILFGDPIVELFQRHRLPVLANGQAIGGAGIADVGIDDDIVRLGHS